VLVAQHFVQAVRCSLGQLEPLEQRVPDKEALGKQKANGVGKQKASEVATSCGKRRRGNARVQVQVCEGAKAGGGTR
jgi:hypothetical protein